MNFQGSDNMFWDPMTLIIRNGINISVRHRDICFARKGDGLIQMTMYTNYEAVHTALMITAGLQTGDRTSQGVFTGIKVDYFDQMQSKLTGFKNDVILAGYPSTSDEFKLIFGLTVTRFYHGMEVEKSNCVKSMADVMHDYVSLTAIEANVRVYYNQLIDSSSSQHTVMSEITGNSADIIAQLGICAGVMDQNLGYAKVLNATNPDRVAGKALTDSWFPLDLIHQYVTQGFEKGVPVSITEYLGTKTFKPGDHVLVTIVGASVNIGTSYDRKHAAVKFVTFHDGVPVLVDPFGGEWDLSQHNWVATNLDATHASHVSFTFQLV
jgi:hypothetical protein